MTPAYAAALAALLNNDEVFEFIANAYTDALETGGGLEQVIKKLEEMSA